MSLKELEEAIKNRPKLDTFTLKDGSVHLRETTEEAFEKLQKMDKLFHKIEVEFDAFKKQNVIKSKRELWDRRQDLEKARDRELNDGVRMIIGGEIQMIDELMPPKSVEELLGKETPRHEE